MGTVGTSPGAPVGVPPEMDELCIPTRIAEHGRSIRAGVAKINSLECKRKQSAPAKDRSTARTNRLDSPTLDLVLLGRGAGNLRPLARQRQCSQGLELE